MERVCENNFVPFIRSGEWSDIGGRDYMEDAHVCISDLAKNFGSNSVDDEVISFYGVITCSLLNIQSIIQQGNHRFPVVSYLQSAEI
jgi:hypothetical protein